MRHRKQKGKLSRDPAHRKALFMNLCREVIDHERIQTTEAKAKAVKPELERLITLAKKREGGYTRILKLGPRRSDSTEMVFLELV
jgi:large subunit ribosomal protein L17